MEKAIMERVKNQVKNLKVLSEELQVQMALGKAEARDLIEAERKNLSNYINRERSRIKEWDSGSAENRRELLTAVEDLESALYAKVPDKAKKYDAYKNDLLRKIYKLEEDIKENYAAMGLEMQETLDGFKAKMDAFRVNLALHDKDDPARVDRIRNEFTDKLEEVRTLLAKEEGDQSKLDHFVEDLSESFNYLKKAIADLSNN